MGGMKRILSQVKHSMRPSNSRTPTATPNQDSSATAHNITTAGVAQTATTTSSLVPIVEDTQTAPTGYNPKENCPLENLPPEVRRHILYLSGFEEIRVLIHASPVFHQQYLLDRRSLLLKFLQTTLGDVIVDAYAVYQCSEADEWDFIFELEVTQFLGSYQDRRCSTQRHDFTARLTEDEVVDILTFHLYFVDPLIRKYTGWTLSNLSDNAEEKSEETDGDRRTRRSKCDYSAPFTASSYAVICSERAVTEQPGIV